MAIVFILGAGFSKEICSDMPLVSDLNRELFNTMKGNFTYRCDIDEIKTKLIGANFEDVLTFLFQEFP